jgi:hypothetical protein
MLPVPSTIIALDPEEFIGASQYAGMVAYYELLEEVPAIGKPLIRTDEGTFGFRNHPDSLFGLAVVRHFRGQPDKAKAFLWRFQALQLIFHNNEMKAYIKGDGDEIEIHGAVFEVAATEKLSDKYEFEPEPFFQRVREVAARMEAEEGK